MDKLYRINLRHINRLRHIFTEFERKVDIQNHEFGLVRFQNRFFQLSNKDDEKYSIVEDIFRYRLRHTKRV